MDNNLETRAEANNGWIGCLVVIILIAGAVWYFNSRTPSWTLLVCEEMLDDTQCSTNAYELHDIPDRETCFSEGKKYLRMDFPGFECANGCDYDKDWGMLVCDNIYDRYGLPN